MPRCGLGWEARWGAGFASGVTGGELSPAGVLLCSGVCVTGGAGMSALLGGKWPWAEGFTWAGPIGGLVIHFCFSFPLFTDLNASL
jgi:hypothetical protein